ncbi:MAG: hypothetical protein R3C70_02675 [Geminicoccaceae bacterium]
MQMLTDGRHLIQRPGPELEASSVDPRNPMTTVGFMRQLYKFLDNILHFSRHLIRTDSASGKIIHVFAMV